MYTNLAKVIEARKNNTHIWAFFTAFLTNFLVHFFKRAIKALGLFVK